jgi:hypothetical protein
MRERRRGREREKNNKKIICSVNSFSVFTIHTTRKKEVNLPILLKMKKYL